MDTSTSFFWQNAQEADDLKRQVYQEQQAKLQQEADDLKLHQEQQACYDLQQKRQQQRQQQRQQEADDLKLHQEQQACYDLQQKRQQQQDRRLNELDNERLVEHSTARAEISDNKKRAKVMAMPIATTKEITMTNKFESLCARLNTYFEYEFTDAHKTPIRDNFDMLLEQEENLFGWMDYINSSDRGDSFERCLNSDLFLFVGCAKDDAVEYLKCDDNLAKCEEWLKYQEDNIIQSRRPWLEDGAPNNGYSTNNNALAIVHTNENTMAIVSNALTIAPTSENEMTIVSTSENALTIAPTSKNVMTIVSTSENALTSKNALTIAPTNEVVVQAITTPPATPRNNREREYSSDCTVFDVVCGDDHKERLLKERKGKINSGVQRDKRLNTQKNNLTKKRNERVLEKRTGKKSTTSTPEAVVSTQRRSSRRGSSMQSGPKAFDDIVNSAKKEVSGKSSLSPMGGIDID
jgi:hypothetical protein